MITFPFNLSIFKAIAAVSSRDETRYVLNGVNCICEPGRPVILQATDGRRLVIHETEWEHDATVRTTFIVPALPISKLQVVSKKNGQARISEKSAVFDLGYIAAEFLLVDGTYPNAEAVLPKVMPTDFPAKSVVLHVGLLPDLLTVIGKLEGIKAQGVRIVGESDTDTEAHRAVILLGMRTTGVLMPMRGVVPLNGVTPLPEVKDSQAA